MDEEGVLQCRGRIEGQYPIYLPDSTPYTKTLVHQAHMDTLHGGVALTMAKLREQYWIPRFVLWMCSIQSQIVFVTSSWTTTD